MKILSKSIFVLLVTGIMLFSSTAFAEDNDNLALGKSVTFSSEQAGNEAAHIVDGIKDDVDNRWSAEGYGSYIIVDLGQEYYLGYSLIYPRDGKQYDYEINVYSDDEASGKVIYSKGKSGSMYFDDLEGAYGRYVKLTVTGGSNDNNWVSLLEFEIYGVDDEINWALGGNISEYSAQQIEEGNENLAAHLIDNNLNTRWSAQGYPNHVVVDLGEPRTISRAEIEPIDGRAYQYRIEASLDGNNYFLLAEDMDNSETQDVISEEFSPVSVRFVRLTITGSGTGNAWVSISEFRVFGTYPDEAKPVTDVSITLSGNTVSMSGTSSAAYGGTVVLVAVVLDGDKMTEIKTAYIDFNGFGTNVSGSVTLDSDLSGKTVEAFVWDNDGSMTSCSGTVLF